MEEAKIQENGTLLFIPKKYGEWDNFQNAATNLKEENGFFKVVYPEITSDQQLGNPYFDEANRVITFHVEIKQSIVLPNEIIRLNREQAYKMHSDSLYMAYQKYLALGEIEKAEAKKVEWIAEVQKIDAENPYNIEV